MFGSIVVGTDGSETAARAVEQAIELAVRVGSGLDIVSAYEPVPEQRLRRETAGAPDDIAWATGGRNAVEAMLNEAAETARQSGVTEVTTFARAGDPADAILDVAEERAAGLIIVGNRGMTGAKRFLLGSVPNKITHHAPCSVLIIKTQ